MRLRVINFFLPLGFTTWEGSQELANYIMEEFWQQGDDETSKGLTTLDNIEPILDRRQSVNLPSLEVSSTKEPLKTQDQDWETEEGKSGI